MYRSCCHFIKCSGVQSIKNLKANPLSSVFSFDIRSNVSVSLFDINNNPASYRILFPVSLRHISSKYHRNFSSHKVNLEKCEANRLKGTFESELKPGITSVGNEGESQHAVSKTRLEDDTIDVDDQENLDVFENIDYDAITGGDSDNLNKFKLLLLEVDVLRQDGCKVPKKISTAHWKELFSLQSRNQRRKLLQFLWTIEIRKINDKKKKEIRRKESEDRKAEFEESLQNNGHIHYGFRGNTIFLRVYDSTINSFDNQRLLTAMMFGLNVVVDCGYDTNMSTIENKLCAKQLCYVFAENRLHRDPFNIHFSNFNKDSVLFHQFKKHIPTLDDPGFPINVTHEHYTKLFPKEKLVYLTPHCRTELKEFNPDDVYIIGALVDKQNNEPLSLAKAKSEGIRMAKFPLDRYLDWSIGTKSLTINQVLKILLDVRSTGDWNAALKHVPQRKIRQPGEPKLDQRRIKYRGTTFQPPPNYRESKRQW